MKTRMFTQATPYDLAEESSGSLDPLGSVTGAEQLAAPFPVPAGSIWSAAGTADELDVTAATPKPETLAT